MRRIILFSILTISVLVFADCSSKKDVASDEATTLIVVNSPVAGEVRRVLVSENIAVDANAPVVEIAVPNTSTNQSNRTAPQLPAPNSRNVLADAQKEVERTSVEISRVEQLVASKLAPQSQLDAARADFQKAQEHLQELRETSANTPTNTQPIGNQTMNTQPDEKIVVVRVPAAGVVRVISVKRGQMVTNGQPLATVSSGS